VFGWRKDISLILPQCKGRDSHLGPPSACKQWDACPAESSVRPRRSLRKGQDTVRIWLCDLDRRAIPRQLCVSQGDIAFIFGPKGYSRQQTSGNWQQIDLRLNIFGLIFNLEDGGNVFLRTTRRNNSGDCSVTSHTVRSSPPTCKMAARPETQYVTSKSVLKHW
jgi:hypothetical protein